MSLKYEPSPEHAFRASYTVLGVSNTGLRLSDTLMGVPHTRRVRVSNTDVDVSDTRVIVSNTRVEGHAEPRARHVFLHRMPHHPSECVQHSHGCVQHLCGCV